MLYRKNPNMDYVPSDETSIAVFDPDSGNTFFFDETGVDILNALDEPCDFDTLLSRICTIYAAKPDDIRSDVKDFLDETAANKVIEIL